MKDFEEKLKALCRLYDVKHGCYPESAFEGASVFAFWKELTQGVTCLGSAQFDGVDGQAHEDVDILAESLLLEVGA